MYVVLCTYVKVLIGNNYVCEKFGLTLLWVFTLDVTRRARTHEDHQKGALLVMGDMRRTIQSVRDGLDHQGTPHDQIQGSSKITMVMTTLPYQWKLSTVTYKIHNSTHKYFTLLIT